MSRTFIALLVVILQQQPSWGSGAYSGHELCEIQNEYDSPYVVPYFERFAVGAGCVSTNVTEDGAEVHIINMIGALGGPDAEVIIHIQPLTPGLHRTPLVFVLNSRHPVTWRIRSENITNTTRNNFMISNNTRLHKDDTIRIKIRKVGTLPTEQSALMEWARMQYGAVTSYTEFDKANTFFKKVGINDSESSNCVIQPDTLFRSSVPAYLVRQPSSGCTAQWNAGRNSRDIHILELHSGTESRNDLTKAEVAIDICTKGGHTVQKKLTLIIKSHRPVKLGIRTKNVRGDLNIFTEQEVDSKGVGYGMQRVSVAVEPEVGERGRRQLMEWVADKYGPALSYTEALLANKFDLIVDGGDDLAPSRVDLLPQDDQQGHQLVNPFDEDQQTWEAVHKHMRITCTSRGIRATLSRAELLNYGVTSRHLSLVSQEGNCWATSNSTHYILYTMLQNCGTSIKRSSNGRTTQFVNGILVHDLRGHSNLNLDEEGSALDPAEQDDTHLDDEDYRVAKKPLKIGFKCDYKTGSPMEVSDSSPSNRDVDDAALNTFSPPADAHMYELSLYSEASFRSTSRVLSYPLQVSVGEMVYVEAKLDTQVFGREAVIDSCWLTSIPDEIPAKPKHPLITNRCVRDNQLHFINDSDTAATTHKYFRFKFVKSRVNEYITFLQCDLTQCARGHSGARPNIERCVDPQRYCINNWPRDKGHIRLQNSVTITLGPLTDMFSTVPDSLHGSAGQERCEQVVHVQGLDSGTVVAIAFSAFCIGILLTAVLWFIHIHTGPMRKSNRPRSTETSGESTPSSTAPITIHQIHA